MGDFEVNLIQSVEIEHRPAFANFLNNGTLIVSTYEQDEDDEKLRNGTFQIFLSENFEDDNEKISVEAGIFRFEVCSQETILAALTNGKLLLMAFKTQNYSKQISQGMLLSAKSNENLSKILCSDNFGNLFVTNLDAMILERKWLAHSLKYSNEPNCEVWDCCWLTNTNNNNFECAASGSEDGLMKLWDLRTNCHTPAQINKSHESGIVFLKQFEENQIISGSYDEHMRVFDLRNLKEALNQVKLNGGVWNITELNSGYFLASCMYGGWSIIRRTNPLKLEYTNNEYGSNLLYGCCASCRQQNNTENIAPEFRIVTCTFNDKKIYEYNLKLPFC